jgi:uncharacterized protein (TIGR00375 family)
MLERILDLHIHSKYSRACSRELELPKIALVCEKKGIDIVATGDFTHPAWFSHIKDSLVEENQGIYKLKNEVSLTRFILSTEIACIYKDKEKCRRLHLVILAPNILAVEKFNQALIDRGVNIKSDGRPIMGISAKEILKMLLAIDKNFMLIPAHAWTPWFAVFGSKSGYNSLEECFEELTPHIRVIETGLSSDPPMNHMLSQLDNITLVSNSDAHSLDKLGREANVLAFDAEKDVTYAEIKRIIESGDKKKFLYTIEFFPEEGKYHFDGHKDCGVCYSPAETMKVKGICPKCGKKLVVGVLNRVWELADRKVKNISSDKFIPHRHIVPLREIIATVFGVGTGSKRVAREYDSLIKELGNEFFILLACDIKKITEVSIDKNISVAIDNMRRGQVQISPGYDGEFGKVKVFSQLKQKRLFRMSS